MKYMTASVVLATTLSWVPLSAPAQTITVTSSQSIGDMPISGYTFNTITGGNPSNQANQLGSGSSDEQVENYQSDVNVTSNQIQFASSATTQGYSGTSGANGVSSVNITTTLTVVFTNTGPTAIVPVLQSTVLPGGFGLYMDNIGANPTLENPYVAGDINQSPQSATATFANLNLQGGESPGAAGFSFTIEANDTPIANYSASVALNGSGSAYTVQESGTPNLVGFGLATPAGSDAAVGYQWSATTFDAVLGGLLQPGQSITVSYISTVYASTDVENNSCGTTTAACPQLLAYSGFGDPIGKATGAGGAADPYFPVFDLSLPTVNPVTGVLGGPTIDGVAPALPVPGTTPATFQPIPKNILTGTPEPGAWALMLVGLGAAGAALRRTRRRAPIRKTSATLAR